jgi:hypothetical protein
LRELFRFDSKITLFQIDLRIQKTVAFRRFFGFATVFFALEETVRIMFPYLPRSGPTPKTAIFLEKRE